MMRVDILESGQVTLCHVPFSEVLADSQFDYSCNAAGGWKFRAQDKRGELTELQLRDRGEDFVTRDVFRIGCSDNYCRVGRDSAHPGYEQWPALLWVAEQDRMVDVSCELAALTALAKSRAVLVVERNGLELCRAAVAFPGVLRVGLIVHVAKGDRLVVSIRSDGIIDNLLCLYYCWVSQIDNWDISPGVLGRVISSVDTDDCWSRYCLRFSELTGVDPQEAAPLLFWAPFAPLDPVAPEFLEVAPGLGQSRFFSVSR